MPGKRRQQNKAVSENRESRITTTERHLYYSGPLPPAAELRQYEEIHPGAAAEIFRMAEANASRRHELETKIVDAESRDSLLGIVSALLVCAMSLSAGCLAILNGFSVAGTIVGGLGITGVVGTFVYGTRRNSGK